MIAVISPSKDLNFKSSLSVQSNDLPRLFDRSKLILDVIKKKKSGALMKLMDISKKLADENVSRYQQFSDSFNSENSRPSIFAFAGDVYRGLDANTLTANELEYCQHHIRILSGLYGLLRPMDLMQPYRLEMGIPLKVSKSKNLYAFWSDAITTLLQNDILNSGSNHLINLASQEYFDAINKKLISVPIINIHFREYKNNELMFVSFTAKKARGLVTRYMALENLKHAEEIKSFNLENYKFESGLSSENDWFFIR